MYGYERLVEIIEKNADRCPSDMLELIKSSVISFTESDIFEDDLTLIIIKVNQVNSQQKSKLITTKFRADLSVLPSVREFVDRLCQKAPLNAKVMSAQLQLAINEAFCNIVKHGYHLKNERQVLIHGRLEENGISIELSDQGIGFNPKTILEPSLSGIKKMVMAGISFEK